MPYGPITPRVHAPDVGPAGPAALLEEFEQARRAREGFEERRVEQRDQVVADGVFLLHPYGFGGCRLDEGGYPVGERRQPWVLWGTVGEVPDVEILPGPLVNILKQSPVHCCQMRSIAGLRQFYLPDDKLYLTLGGRVILALRHRRPVVQAVLIAQHPTAEPLGSVW